MYPSWVSWNTHLACTPDINKTNPFHSYRGVQVPIQTWTPSPHTWDPVPVRCLDLHLSLPPISRSRKSQNPRQESNKPSRSHKQVCARDNKSMTWLPSTATDGPQSTRTGKQCNQAKPRGGETQPVTPTSTHTNPYPVTIFLPLTYHESNNIHLLVSNGRLLMLPMNLSIAATRSYTSKTHDIYICMWAP
jgi:hypothetical protein